MKRIGLFLIGILFAVIVNGQTMNRAVESKPVYKDYGAWSIQAEDGQVGVRAFITKERVYDVEQKQYAKELTDTTPKYRYELYLESKSIYRGEPTSTWLYKARVFINGREVTYMNYPDGFTVNVTVKPTLVYWYEVPMIDLDMAITWESAIYENRTF